MNPATRRSNKRIVVAINESDAVKKGYELGFTDPVVATEIETEMATQRQISYALQLGITVPHYATKIDASALICRVHDEDFGVALPDIIQTATAAGLVISTLSGPTLAKSILKQHE